MSEDEIDRIAQRLYTDYSPESRGESPNVTEAACQYLAKLMVENERGGQKEIAEEYDCTVASLQNRKNQIVEELQLQ